MKSAADFHDIADKAIRLAGALRNPELRRQMKRLASIYRSIAIALEGSRAEPAERPVDKEPRSAPPPHA